MWAAELRETVGDFLATLVGSKSVGTLSCNPVLLEEINVGEQSDFDTSIGTAQGGSLIRLVSGTRRAH